MSRLPHTHLLPLVFAALLSFGALLARAQETWLPAASPTAENLWGVAHGTVAGTDLFVAVGDHGTILTAPSSSAGALWTPRASGTTRWLAGVTFAAHQFVAVGEAGTVLTSSDGIAWTPRASGTTERLNAVAHGNDRWLAVGENSTVLISDDSLTWRPVARSFYAPSPVWIRGLCYAYGTFVATGQSGTLFSTVDGLTPFTRTVDTATSFEGLAYARRRFVATGSGGLILTASDSATWRATSSSTTESLHAVTFFNNHFVAAGDHGTVLTSPDAKTWTPRPTGSTALLTALASDSTTLVAVGFGGVILHSTAAQSAPAIVTPPVDLTEAIGNHVLLSVTATGSAPLSYQWSFNGQPLPGATSDTLELRAVTASQSGRYTVAVANPLGSIATPAAILTVIPGFPAVTDYRDATFRPIVPYNAAPSALLAQPDGKILLAVADTVSRLLPDGPADSTFTATPLPGTATVATFALQPDGKILVGGTSASGTGTLARLGSTGQLDPTFTAPAAALGTAITDLVVQPDGKILLANGTTRVVRLLADGTPDPTFAGADLSAFKSSTGAVPAVKRLALAPDGKILLASSPLTWALGQIRRPVDVLVARLLPTGALDPAFSATLTGTLQPVLLALQSDGRILLASDDNSFSYSEGRWLLQRLNTDGTHDLTFLPHSGFIPKYGGNMRATVDARSRIVVAVAAAMNVNPSPNLMRFDSDGTIDPTLRGEDPTNIGNLNTLAPTPDGRVLFSRGSSQFVRLVAANAPRLNPPVALSAASPAPLPLVGGTDATFTTHVAGTGSFRYDWTVAVSSGESAYPSYNPSADSLTVRNLRSDGIAYTTVTNPAGTLFYPPQSIRVLPSPPRFVTPPANLAVEAGRIALVPFDATGSGPLTYRWLFHDREIASGTSRPMAGNNDPYSVSSALGALQIFTTDDAALGEYELILTNPLGSISARLTLSRDPTSRLINLSTRGFVGPGDQSLFAGFVVSGSLPKWVLIRGIGPGLTPFGVTGALSDPKLTLFDATGTPLAENDNWLGNEESYTTANWPAMFALPTGSRDAIIERQLPPGTYTVQLTGVAGATGSALVEIYDQIHDTPRLINLSTRVLVRSAADPAIAGFVVRGSTPRTLLLRAVGPTLSSFGVAAPLADPRLTLTAADGTVVATNDDWATASPADLAALRTATASVGAFALSPNSRDAALLLTLPPGSYTAQVTGSASTTGVALVEIYEVP